MPPHEILTIGHEAIGASWWQPGNGLDQFGREFHAVGNVRVTLGVVRAEAGASIEKPAGDVSEVDIRGVLIFQLDQAAAAAAVAQALPFRHR